MRPPLFGPVLYYDAVRTARRARYTLARALYALGLLGLLAVIYASQSRSMGWGDAHLDPQQLSSFATGFFVTFLIFQFFLAAVLTPAYVAGAIAEEKERRTLEFLMATDLRSREIVLSKLVSRVGNLLMFLLAGLPVISLIQLFGGVDPQLLWAGFLGTGSTILSLSGLGLLISVYTTRARTAIARTLVLGLGYFIFYFLLLWAAYAVIIIPAMTAGAGGAWANREWTTLERAFLWGVEFFGTGHPVHNLSVFIRGGGGFTSALNLRDFSLASTPMEATRNYCLWHGLLFLVCISLAVLRLRPVFVRQTFGAASGTRTGKKTRGGKPEVPGRAVTDPPMVWKEFKIERGRLTLMGRLMLGLTGLACLFPAGYNIWYELTSDHQYKNLLAENMAIYVSIVGTLVACLAFLGIGIRAAGSIGSERDRQTLDSLLASQLTIDQILYAKWLGAWWGGRHVLGLLLLVWLVAFCTGGLPIFAMLLLTIAVLLYGSAAASLGLWFSAASKTTTRATVGMILTLFFFMGGFWIFVGPLGALGSHYIGPFFAGQTPPFVLGSLAYLGQEHGPLNSSGRDETQVYQASTVLSLVLAAIVAFASYLLAGAAFVKQSGRLEQRSR